MEIRPVLALFSVGLIAGVALAQRAPATSSNTAIQLEDRDRYAPAVRDQVEQDLATGELVQHDAAQAAAAGQGNVPPAQAGQAGTPQARQGAPTPNYNDLVGELQQARDAVDRGDPNATIHVERAQRQLAILMSQSVGGPANAELLKAADALVNVRASLKSDQIDNARHELQDALNNVVTARDSSPSAYVPR